MWSCSVDEGMKVVGVGTRQPSSGCRHNKSEDCSIDCARNTSRSRGGSVEYSRKDRKSVDNEIHDTDKSMGQTNTITTLIRGSVVVLIFLTVYLLHSPTPYLSIPHNNYINPFHSRILSSFDTSRSSAISTKKMTNSHHPFQSKPNLPKSVPKGHIQPQNGPSAPLYNVSSNMSLYLEVNIHKYLLVNDNQLKSAIQKAGFRIVNSSPHQAFRAFKIHSVRSGSADRLDGIGAKCDWSITWNAVLYGVTAIPRIVCMGTRQIEKFWKLVPNLTRSRFILVTAGGDRLHPLGNAEYPPYQGFGLPDGGPGWKVFTTSPNILHVFAENHNMNHSRYSTLPCGFPHNKVQSPANLLQSVERNLKPYIPFDDRPIQVLVSDRVRGGEWYQDRVLANEYCVNVSSSFCSTKLDLDLPGNGNGLTTVEISHAKFVWSVQNSQFVMCTHGGGLDPSPKAWETLLIGSIPIIQHSTLDDGYARFPVVIVQNLTEFLFNADGKSPGLLEQWLEEMKPYFEVGSSLRQEVLHRLTHDYWFNVLTDKYDEMAISINNIDEFK